MYKRDVATIYEVEALEKLREIPRLNHALPMPGFARQQINYDLQRWRERRIDYLNSRLTVASLSMSREFDRSR